ncbi:chorion class A protein Ld5 [Epargyreus clarus]|uniref:chorion class A protein Ld5 n=1 Tax=Epargyreus clarus TaxID=520877 RepID=UPI003C2AE31D
MNTFAFALLCIQACLVQNVFSQCIAAPAPCAGPFAGPYGPGPFVGPYGPAGPLAGPFATGPVGAYGGAGIGEVAVAGELPVAGTTLVAGQVPILGAVEFGGIVPAAGAVSIAGSCACGCAGPYGAGPYGPGYIY